MEYSFYDFLKLLGSLALFLYGMKIMSEGLQKFAGDRLRKILTVMTTNRVTGVLTGMLITALVQSSSATTVMVVGFVNAGVMTLKQATAIIMGANIGTTVTAQIVALQSLPVTAFFAALACVGAFMTMLGKDKVNRAGQIIGSIGMIFVGLDVMSAAMSSFSGSETVTNVMASISNPFLLLLIGMVITAIIQSSSATTSILITMAGAGLMTLENAIFITLGINIGTCITAVLASIGATVNGKRASVIHLMFNVFGSVVFFILALCLPIDEWLQAAFPEIETQIAMFHTIFNVTTTVLLVGFIKYITKLSELIVRDKKQKPNEDGYVADRFNFVDERLLATPTIAIAQVRKEIELMAEIAKKNLDFAVGAVKTRSLDKKDKFASREEHLNFLLKELTSYIVKTSTNPLTAENEREISSYYRVISDLERVGDYAENIVEYADMLIKQNASLSADAAKELEFLYGRASGTAAAFYGVSARLRVNVPLEQAVREMAGELKVPEAVSFAEVFAAARRAGGRIDQVILKTVQTLSGRLEVREEIGTLLKGRRYEQKIMKAVPLLILVYMELTSPDYFGVLYGTVAGRIIMTVCLAVYLAAWVLADRIGSIEV